MSFIRWIFFWSDFLKFFLSLSSFISKNVVYYSKYAPDLDGSFCLSDSLFYSFSLLLFLLALNSNNSTVDMDLKADISLIGVTPLLL